jgi:hypothetical protein
MALVFYDSPESPAECAMEISRKLTVPDAPKVRTGIHSGPVSGVVIIRRSPLQSVRESLRGDKPLRQNRCRSQSLQQIACRAVALRRRVRRLEKEIVLL